MRRLPLSLLLTAGCASAPTPPAETADAPGWEGFFELDRLEDGALEARGIPVARATLEALRPRILRLILATGEKTAPEAELEAAFAQYCADPADRAWNEDRCAGYEARACDAGRCTYRHFGSCSGVLVGGDRALTAAHCVAYLKGDLHEASRVLVPGRDGRPERFTFEVLGLGKTDFEHHWVTDEPDAVDLALLRVPSVRAPKIEPARPPARGGVVFVFGYPRVEGRANPEGYRRVPGRLSVSFGRIDDRNDAGRPFCSVDGRQEGWRHAADCPRIHPPDDQTMWRGRIATHTFTTTMDTINGYSGAPVFDAEGRWIGVNSTVAGGVNPQEGYAPALRAVVTDASAARLLSTRETE